jgi:hypothetical protein
MSSEHAGKEGAGESTAGSLNALTPLGASDDRKFLVDLLRDEIATLTADYQRPGWSLWVLLASLERRTG